MGTFPSTPLRAAVCLAVLTLCCSAMGEQFNGDKRVQNAITCIKQKTPLDCDLLDDCVWCEKPGSRVGVGCYPMSAAKILPKSWGVECDKAIAPATENELKGRLVAGACDHKPEAACLAPDCAWCTSAAVGGGCYTPAEAQLLPKAIFKCKTAPSADAA